VIEPNPNWSTVELRDYKNVWPWGPVTTAASGAHNHTVTQPGVYSSPYLIFHFNHSASGDTKWTFKLCTNLISQQYLLFIAVNFVQNYTPKSTGRLLLITACWLVDRRTQSAFWRSGRSVGYKWNLAGLTLYNADVENTNICCIGSFKNTKGFWKFNAKILCYGV